MKLNSIIHSIFLLIYISGSFNAQDKNKTTPVKDTVAVGYSTSVFTLVNIEDAKAATDVFMDKLLEEWNQTGVKPIARIYDDFNLLKKDISRNKLDLLVLSTKEYFDIKNKEKIIPFQVYMHGDYVLNKMFLICRNDAGINTINDLKEKKIIICKTFKGNENLNSIWFQTLILQNKEDYKNRYASNITYLEKPLRCVADVFLKKADALVISDAEFESVKSLNPQFGHQLKLVASSKPLLYSVLCYTTKIKTQKLFTLDEFAQKLDKMHESKVGKQFLTIFRIDSFVPFKYEYLADTEDLLNQYNKLTKGRSFELRVVH
jgi:hypothetical protein